jgi:ABC-type Zn uptake system ZnuABC Zn-binding protein ZnuA
MIFRRILAVTAAAVISAVTVAGCGVATKSSSPTSAELDARPVVVATTSIVADFATRIAGDAVTVRTLVPNGFDAHTYEPKPSELAMLGNAALVVLADEDLNAAVTGLVRLSGEAARVLDLNATALTAEDFVYRESGNAASANPHTWTSPVLAARWVNPLAERIAGLVPARAQEVRANAQNLLDELDILDRDIRAAIGELDQSARKLVVYHDAWQYFGREYGLQVVGALQAVSYAEPSAAELARMAEQIRAEGVPAFFGSEVFPSDVLQALEEESGARYIADLADDRLPGEPGDEQHSYVSLMRANLALLVDGLNA